MDDRHAFDHSLEAKAIYLAVVVCVTAGRLAMAVVGGGRAIFLVTKEENRWTKCNYYIDTDDEAGYSIEEGTTAGDISTAA